MSDAVLKGTSYLTLTIEPSYHPNWWEDSSYTIHPDMRVTLESS